MDLNIPVKTILHDMFDAPYGSGRSQDCRTGFLQFDAYRSLAALSKPRSVEKLGNVSLSAFRVTENEVFMFLYDLFGAQPMGHARPDFRFHVEMVGEAAFQRLDDVETKRLVHDEPDFQPFGRFYITDA
jgi:hypothetical protein